MREVVGIQVEIEPEVLAARADGDGRNGRHAVAPVPVVKHRRLAPGRPGAAHRGDQLEAGFIGKCEVRVQSADFFLIPGQMTRFQSAIAGSSRSNARRSGFWHDHPKSASSRPTWVGW